MFEVSRRRFLQYTALGTGSLLAGEGANALAAIAPGVETIAAPIISGEERTLQPDVWALEVNFKPVRMIRVDLPIPGTGRTSRQLVWYLCYRVVNRPLPGAKNENLPPAERPLFVPELTLVTEDNGIQRTYLDRVMPAAQAAINRRERHKYKNSVEIAGPLPDLTPYKSKTETSLDGVAMWRGIDPKTDFFKVFFAGFSNGYRVMAGPDGKELIQRKTLVQQFWRPSDQFDENEAEIRLMEQPKWVYR